MNSLHLLQLEWRRFAPHATFRALVILYVALFGLLTYVAHLIGKSLPVDTAGYLFTQPALWQFLAYVGSWLNFSLLALCGVFLITTEWSHRTLRQSVIFGMSRNQVALSKLLSALALAAAATVVCLISGVITSLFLQTGGGWLPPGEVVGRFFMQAFGCLVFGLTVGLVIRQTAAATLAVLAYLFIVEAVARTIVVLAVFPTRAVLFLPDHVMEKLTPFPMPAILDQMTKVQQQVVPLSAVETVAAAAVWLGVGIAFIFWRLRRVDL